MLVLSDKTFFEENAAELLSKAGLNKAKFAEKMGVARQNIQKVFETKNVFTLVKAAEVLSVSLDFLITGKMEDKCSIDGFVEINGETHRLRSREDLVQALEKTSTDI